MKKEKLKQIKTGWETSNDTIVIVITCILFLFLFYFIFILAFDYCLLINIYTFTCIWLRLTAINK